MSSPAFSDPAGFQTLEKFAAAPAFNRWLYQAIRPELKGRILEIGSGTGNISQFLLAGHTEVSLSDLRPEYGDILELKFKKDPHLGGIHLLDLSLPDFDNRYAGLLGCFDTVVALNVLEHIADDLEALVNAGKLLSGQGKLVLLVPAFPALFNSLDRELGHFRRYTPDSLERLLLSAGLQFTGCRYFNTAAIPGWWLSGSLLHHKMISATTLNWFNRLVPVFRTLDRMTSSFAGISLISTGIKNLT